MSSGRKSTARMETIARTREQQIAGLIAVGGYTNEQVWQFYEIQQPEIVKPDDPKREAGLVNAPYDGDERGRIGRAIRSVRGLAKKATMDNQELMEVLAEGETRSASEVDYENIKRFPSGDPDMDDIYGTTHYRWLMPAELKKGNDDKPVMNYETGKKWSYGDLIPKKMLKHMNPKTGEYEEGYINSDLQYGALFGDKTGYKETGIPVGFLDVVGGQAGIGKSRLVLELTKSVCAMYPNEAVLYNYGESNMAQLRQWIGPKAPENLILGERKTLPQFIADIYKYRPILTVQDSLQMLIETRSASGLRETLGILKQLANEEAANRTHITLISHLNKKGDLKGTSDLGFLVDAIFKVFKQPMARKGEFRFESEKNRGGPTPNGRNYKHTDDGIICLGSGSRSNKLNLIQSSNPIIQQGMAG